MKNGEPHTDSEIMDVGRWTLDIGHWTLDVELRTMDGPWGLEALSESPSIDIWTVLLV
jgi:hypothetical protein